ncbi:MAG: hypothetical protein RL404_446 [Pseudomonadota bacterium]
MDVLTDLLNIKIFREEKAERALVKARDLLRAAEEAVVLAKKVLRDYREESRQREQALFADLCKRIVLLKDIQDVQIDIQLMKERIDTLVQEVEQAKERQEEAAEHERGAREEHKFAVRMREKFGEMLRTVHEERDFELSRREELEVEEAAEIRHVLARAGREMRADPKEPA